MSDLSRRTLARYLAEITRLRGVPQHMVMFDDLTFFPRMADAAPGQRKNDHNLTQPINKPRGIDREIVKENARTEDGYIEETVTPDRKDVQPKDVFAPTPNHMNVLNFAETGKDQDQVLRTQIPKDKGWETVRNLSQYLVRTEGGGGTPPAGK